MKIRKFISKTANFLFIPIIILGGISLVFEKELSSFQFITPLRWIILICAVVIVISGIIDLVHKKK